MKIVREPFGHGLRLDQRAHVHADSAHRAQRGQRWAQGVQELSHRDSELRALAPRGRGGGSP